MSEFTQKFLSILLLFVIGFVLLNIFTDVKDYFYSKICDNHNFCENIPLVI